MNNVSLPREVVNQALEALEYENSWHEILKVRPYASTVDAITALRAALAQQDEPVEPVAWMFESERNFNLVGYGGWEKRITECRPNALQSSVRNVTALYTAPPQRPTEPVQGPEGMVEFLADLQRSRTKYPKNRRMFDGLMGEIDELRRAYAGDGDIRAEAFDVAVCAFRIATEGDAGGNARLEQAESDHETRAELAEQQVVQLAEERDHYRNLWQKAQQAEPVQEPVLVVEKEPDYWSRGHFYQGSKPHIDRTKVWNLPIGTKLYTVPPQRKPLPLKDVERLIYENTKINPNVADDKELLGYIVNAIRAVERAHNIVE